MSVRVFLVMPAKAGIHAESAEGLRFGMDPSYRWGDGEGSI
jgi:hypothetical protein